MRDHLHDRAGDRELVAAALGVEQEKAQGDEAHVGDRRVGDQLLHVGLHQGDEADVDDGDQRQRDHEPGPLVAGVGRDRQREPEEAVGAELQHDRRQHDRAAGRRLDVGVGQPGVHRPHRHLDREGEEEGEEQQHLGIERQRQAVPGEDVEAAARLVVEVDQRHQHQQRAGERVEEELERRVDAARPAPDADDEVHRDQRRLEEDVEQQAVEGAEHADQEAREDQERAHVLVDALGDHLPRRDDDDHGDEGREQDEPDREAVDAEQVPDVEAADPGLALGELHRRAGGVEAGDQRDRDQEARQRGDQRGPAHRLGAVVAAEGEQEHAREDGQPDRDAQQGHVLVVLDSSSGR